MRDFRDICNYRTKGKSVENYHKKTKYNENKTSCYLVVLNKIQFLPISKHIKDSLLRLAINRTVTDIKKLVKVSKRSVTFQGRVIIKGVEIADDVLIKVFNDSNEISEHFYSYTSTKDASYLIKSYSDYKKEDIILYKSENVVFLKLLKNCKNIKQMMKSFPNKKNELFFEFLTLYSYITYYEPRRWQNYACNTKNILWHDGKLILLNANRNIKKKFSRDLQLDNFLKSIKIFSSYMSNDNLKQGIRKITKADICYDHFPLKLYNDRFLETCFP